MPAGKTSYHQISRQQASLCPLGGVLAAMPSDVWTIPPVRQRDPAARGLYNGVRLPHSVVVAATTRS